MTCAIAALALAAALLAGGGRGAAANLPSPAPSATLAPEALYAGAVEHLLALPQSPYLAYVMTQTSQVHGKIAFSFAQAVIERRADRVSWNRFLAGDAAEGDIVIGRHYLIPDAFIPYENRDVPAGALPLLESPPPTGGLRTIATVRSAISYRVRAVGTEHFDECGDAVHLVLDPLHDPESYNVRALWVRPSDFRICKATFESRLFQESSVHAAPYPLRVDAVLDDRGLITDAVSQLHALTINGPIDDLGVVKFTDAAWQASEQGYLFSREAWERHQASPTASPTP